MTINKVSDLRESIGFPVITHKDYDPDLTSELFSNDIINFNDSKILRLMDVGFIIPKSSYAVNPLCNECWVSRKDYYDEKENAFYFHLKQALCVYSSKNKKNLISKSKLKFTNSYYIYYNYIHNTNVVTTENEKSKKMYVWRYGDFSIRDNQYSEIEHGYELTILDEKLQIEDRAYYIIF